MVAYVPALFALAGLLMFVLSEKPKIVEIGKIMLFCGLLVTLMSVADKTVNLLGK